MAIEYHEAQRLDLFWLGRYTLPRVAGAPSSQRAIVDGREVLTAVRARLTAIMCLAIGVAEFATPGVPLL